MKIDSSLQQKFVTLGLTPQESNIYLLISRHPQIKVEDISEQLQIPTPSIHRSLLSLKQKNLILTTCRRPLKLQIIDPNLALSEFIDSNYQQQLNTKTQIINEIKKQIPSQNELGVQFLKNKQEAFDYALPIIKNVKNEILILSVGEPIPQDLFFEFFKALKSGVEIKLIAQTYNQENRELLHNWQKNGWKIRYLTDSIPDFTLVIYDQDSCLVQIRQAKDKEQRLGIAINNHGYVEAQQKYFYTLWSKAKSI